MRPLAVIRVKNQFENVGDAWIYRELIRLVAERAETLVDLSRCPPHFVRSLAVGTYSHAQQVSGLGQVVLRLTAARARGQNAYYFLAPGAHFRELGLKRLARAWWQTMPYLLLRAIGVRICNVGVSFEHLGPRHAHVWAFRSRLMHAQLVRDQGSADHATSLGIRIHGVMPDLSLAIDPPPATEDTTAPTTIAVCFRVDQRPDHLPDVLARMTALATTLQEVGVAVRWRLVCQVERDEPGLRALATTLQQLASEVELVLVSHDLTAARAAYTGCHYVLGNRLHGLMLGASMAAVPVAWIDPILNVKITRNFGELGMQDHVHHLAEPASVEAIARTVQRGDLQPLNFDPPGKRLATIFDGLLQE